MNRKRLVTVAAIALAVALVAGAAFLFRQVFFGPNTITAYFPTATSIYPGDEVRVSGVKVGKIDSITPEGTQTKMTLKVDRGVPVPADAKAVIVAQNLIAARYVQLTPAYRNGAGPTMRDGAVIPSDRTAVPVDSTVFVRRLCVAASPVVSFELGHVGSRLLQTAAPST